jgi:hypothetical protein
MIKSALAKQVIGQIILTISTIVQYVRHFIAL